jgi:hypothetical protein
MEGDLDLVLEVDIGVRQARYQLWHLWRDLIPQIDLD